MNSILFFFLQTNKTELLHCKYQNWNWRLNGMIRISSDLNLRLRKICRILIRKRRKVNGRGKVYFIRKGRKRRRRVGWRGWWAMKLRYTLPFVGPLSWLNNFSVLCKTKCAISSIPMTTVLNLERSWPVYLIMHARCDVDLQWNRLCLRMYDGRIFLASSMYAPLVRGAATMGPGVPYAQSTNFQKERIMSGEQARGKGEGKKSLHYMIVTVVFSSPPPPSKRKVVTGKAKARDRERERREREKVGGGVGGGWGNWERDRREDEEMMRFPQRVSRHMLLST